MAIKHSNSPGPPPQSCLTLRVSFDSALCWQGDGRRSILLNNLHRHHPLTASLHNLPPPLYAYSRQITSESSQPQPFLTPGMQLVETDSPLSPWLKP